MSPDGLNLSDWTRMLGGMAFTFALLIGGALFVRKAGLFGVQPLGTPKRMKISEMAALDPKRRLVLVRVDEEEHLILLGERETVIRSGPAKTLSEPLPPPEVPRVLQNLPVSLKKLLGMRS
jgi:flagellar protein FliO/FliZ